MKKTLASSNKLIIKMNQASLFRYESIAGSIQPNKDSPELHFVGLKGATRLTLCSVAIQTNMTTHLNLTDGFKFPSLQETFV